MSARTWKQQTPWILVGLCLLGILLTGYLTKQHYKATNGQLDEPSICTFNSTFDCDAVNLSKYSKFMGYPLSAVGMGLYFLLLGFGLYTIYFPTVLGRNAIAWMICLSLMSIVFDVYLLAILLLVLKVICIFCVVTYLVNIAIFFLAWKAVVGDLRVKTVGEALQTAMRSIVKPFAGVGEIVGGKGYVIFGWVFILILAGTSVALSQYWNQPAIAMNGSGNGSGGGDPLDPAEIKERIRNMLLAQTVVTEDLQVSEGPTKGSIMAPITFVEFSDFECPHCARAAELFNESVGKYKDKVRLVFKNYPLDRSCNAEMTRDLHQNACLFAFAIVCARKQPPRDLSWLMHDILFEKGKMLDRESMIDEAVKIGLERKSFGQCLDAPATRKTVERDIELANRLNINSTPTIYINGRLLPNYNLLQPQYFPLLVEVALEDL